MWRLHFQQILRLKFVCKEGIFVVTMKQKTLLTISRSFISAELYVRFYSDSSPVAWLKEKPWIVAAGARHFPVKSSAS